MPSTVPVPLRVAMLAPGELFGGAERQILILLSQLAQLLPTAPLLVTFHDRDLTQRAREQGIRTLVLGAPRVIDPPAIARIRKVIDEERIDVVNVHGYRAAAYLALAVKPGRVGVVKTEHGGVEFPGNRLRDRIRPVLYRSVENFAARRLRARMVYVTRDLQSRYGQEHAGLSQAVIYNGIDALSAEGMARPPELARESFNFVAVGRLEPVKGLDSAIQALADPRMPAAAHLHVIGSGPERERLEALAHSLGVTPRVSFLGFRKNTFEFFAHADALVMPSLHEGLPYTLLEALSLGSAVIASAVGGLAEVLKDGETALFIRPQDPASLAAAVARLAGSEGLRQELQRRGRELVRQKFSAGHMAEAYVQEFASSREAPAGVASAVS